MTPTIGNQIDWGFAAQWGFALLALAACLGTGWIFYQLWKEYHQ